MRVKDELKQQAIIDATIKLVNEIGFAASSVSKIAAEAGVSPATLYIYYKNKEDLLVSTYVDIKIDLSNAILTDFNDSQPIRDIFLKIWVNMFKYFQKNPDLAKYKEQFANSPYAELVDKEKIDKYYEPLTRVVMRGIEQKIIKNINYELFAAFMFQPVIALSNQGISKNFVLTDENIENAFGLAWDAIKL